MERVRRCIDKRTAYDLIASHGNEEDLVFFAELVQGEGRGVGGRGDGGEGGRKSGGEK